MASMGTIFIGPRGRICEDIVPPVIGENEWVAR